MPINSDSLLNFTFFTLDYEKTINLCDCQKNSEHMTQILYVTKTLYFHIKHIKIIFKY